MAEHIVGKGDTVVVIIGRDVLETSGIDILTCREEERYKSYLLRQLRREWEELKREENWTDHDPGTSRQAIEDLLDRAEQ